MTKLTLLSAGLIAAAMLATPAMARESHETSRHALEDANASVPPGARYIVGGDNFRGDHLAGGGYGACGNCASCLGGGFRCHEGRDVWGHLGAYYGPMVPMI
jgi:hypothetical protein